MVTELDSEKAAEVVLDADDLIRRHRRLQSKLEGFSEEHLRVSPLSMPLRSSRVCLSN